VALTFPASVSSVNGSFGKYAISIPSVTGTPGRLWARRCRYSLTTSTLVAGKVNSLLYIRNGDVAEVWINGVSQGSQTVGNNLVIAQALYRNNIYPFYSIGN
jgi:hypothetical protein